MVSRGFVASDKRIPSPDLSFVRLIKDKDAGWTHRGQFVIWTGVREQADPKYRLLERHGNKVAPIVHPQGHAVMHRIPAGVAFTVENLMGYWWSFDSDTMWLDLPASSGQYAVLTVGGIAGKPASATVDCTCAQCGAALSPQSFVIGPHQFKRLLEQAESWVAEFNGDPQRRTCGTCGSVHTPIAGFARDEARPSAAS